VAVPEGLDREVPLRWKGRRTLVTVIFGGEPPRIRLTEVEGVDLRRFLDPTARAAGGGSRRTQGDDHAELALAEVFGQIHLHLRGLVPVGADHDLPARGGGARFP